VLFRSLVLSLQNTSLQHHNIDSSKHICKDGISAIIGGRDFMNVNETLIKESTKLFCGLHSEWVWNRNFQFDETIEDFYVQRFEFQETADSVFSQVFETGVNFRGIFKDQHAVVQTLLLDKYSRERQIYHQEKSEYEETQRKYEEMKRKYEETKRKYEETTTKYETIVNAYSQLQPPTNLPTSPPTPNFVTVTASPLPFSSSTIYKGVVFGAFIVGVFVCLCSMHMYQRLLPPIGSSIKFIQNAPL